MTGALHEDVFIFMTISYLILLRIRNISNKSFRKNQNTYFIFSGIFSENRAVYEIMSKGMIKPERTQKI
jgi:hypothetical protein